jgi:hypothetical protein
MFGIDFDMLAKSLNNDWHNLLAVSAPANSRPQPFDWSNLAIRREPDKGIDWVKIAAQMRGNQPLGPARMASPIRQTASAGPLMINQSTNNQSVDSQRAAALDMARQMYGEEAARVLDATFDTEAGWGGAVGDTDLNPVGSHGPLQFYGGGGMLNAFAADKGIKDLAEAGRYVRTNPLEAVQWALKGYYGSALKAGMDAGLSGADLATYVQQYGQRSVAPERAGAAYRRKYGG